MMEQDNLLQISGTVDNIIYQNEDSGFTVLELESNKELIVAVGDFSGVDEGEELLLTGVYTTHPTYGYQFKASVYERRLPSTANAICKYLSSGAIRGVGPAIAKRIVDTFGTDTLDIIENDPIRLASIKGISQKKAEEIGEEYKQLFGVRVVMLFLAEYGISATQGIKIWKKWGSLATEIIKENPYALCNENFRINFLTADQIAEKMGLKCDNVNRIRAALQYVLTKNLSSGHTCLPSEKLVVAAQNLLEIEASVISDVLEDMISANELYGVERGKLYVYLPAMITAESYITTRLTLLVNEEPNHKDSVDKIIDCFEKTSEIKYADLQRKAIRMSLENKVLILTGGPGTGKTTTLNAIISILESQGENVLIAAPTGRAAKRISELTGKDAKTVHRLLEVKFDDSDKSGFVHNEEKPLDCDVLIIDEMSMMDTLLFDSLLRALPVKSKLIMVGDSDQLPSVGAGNVLKDLIEADVIPTVELKEIFRQAAESMIVMNAHSIVNGEMPDISRVDSDFFFIGRSDMATARQTVVDLCSERLPKSYSLNPLEDIEVLCPGRKGEIGTVQLNSFLQDKLNPKSDKKAEYKTSTYTFREGDKVMQIKNNYDIAWTKGNETGLGIFNGDIGRIIKIDRVSDVIKIDYENRVAVYSLDMASELELAYAITVHKSQGSEFNAVIMPVLGGYDKLYYRNLLYTAVTRAKKYLIIVGSRNRLKFMVENNKKTLRYTGLKYFLTNGIVF